MEDVTGRVANQYGSYPYPQPVEDLAEWLARGNSDPGDPSQYSAMLWPEGRPRRELSILVAGCGTRQAAAIAFANRECTVLGVDISETSLAHSRRLQERHGLANLRLHRADLREAARLGQRFDLIVSTGVLHHMSDAGEGLRSLAPALEPSHGAMIVMVYGQVLRVGVHLLQEALRRLGAAQDAEGVRLARAVMAALPEDHPAIPYVRHARDLAHDAGVVDTLLHVRERAFRVPEVLELVAGAGLEFQGWADNIYYLPDARFPAGSPVGDAIRRLPPREQWAVVENLTNYIGKHVFLACHAGRARRYAYDFATEGWPSLIPVQHPLFRTLEAANVNPPGNGRYSRASHLFAMSPAEALLYGEADGRRPIAELIGHPLIAAHTGTQRLEFARAFYERMWRMGHMFFSKVPVK